MRASLYDGRVVWKLPDEFFRRRPETLEGEEGAAGVDDVPAEPPAPTPVAPSPDRREASRPAPQPEVAPEPRRPLTVPLRAAAILVAGSLALGFFVGRQLLATPAPTSVPSPSIVEPEPSPLRSPSGSEGTIHDGPTRLAVPVAVASNCAESDSAALMDSRQDSAWRCEGDGRGRTVTFTFAGAQPIVGLRIASGNPADRESTKAQRQLLTLRWRFSDGSWFEQGFSGRNAATQEVAFPQIEATGVEMEILATTDPADPDAEGADAISISRVEFLAVE